MPRKKKVHKSKENCKYLDPLYHDPIVSLFINRIMVDGKKSIAERICYNSFSIVKKSTNNKPVNVFHLAIENIKPSLELKSLRVGKSTYQVPFPIHERRQIFFAIKWLVDLSQKKKNRSIEENLSEEIINASQNRGPCVEQKQRLHKMAEANRAYLRYRW